jgi:hypothetical protein
MPEHSGHGGGHGPVIPPADQFSELYGELRAHLLSRHFALGRYFRADHLCFYTYLGVVHRTGGTPDNNLNDLVHSCLWSNVLNGNGTNVYPRPIAFTVTRRASWPCRWVPVSPMTSSSSAGEWAIIGA